MTHPSRTSSDRGQLATKLTTPMFNETTTSISFDIPDAAIDSTKWLRSQSPNIVAECFSISEASWKALQRELSEGETSKLKELLDDVQEKLKKAEKTRLDALETLREELQGDRSLEIGNLKKRHDEAILKIEEAKSFAEEEFRRRLSSNTKLRDEMEKNFADEREELLRSQETQLVRIRESNDLMKQSLQQRIDSLLHEIQNQRAHETETRQFLKDEFQEQLQQIRASYETQLAEQKNMQTFIKSQHMKELEEESQRHVKERKDMCNDHSSEMQVLKDEMHKLKKEYDEEKKLAIEELQAKIGRLTHELGEYDTRLQNERLQMKENFQELLQTNRQSLENKMQEERNIIDREREFLRNEIAEGHRLREKILIQKDELAIKMAADIADIEAKNKEALAKLYEEKENLYKEKENAVSEQKDFLNHLRGNVGKVGENFVQQIHSRLEIGTWHDTSHNEGCGDALWEYELQGTKLKALVEIKNVVALHSKKDLEKFFNDVSAGVRHARINAACFISIKARVASLKPLQIMMHANVPVLFISRDNDDLIPPTCLVQMGFLALAQAWPFLSRPNSENSEGVIESVINQFEAQLLEITKFSKRIDMIEKTGISLQREASGLRKIRDSMIQGIEQTRVSFPQLCPNPNDFSQEALPQNAGSVDQAKFFKEKIQSYREIRGRYPKTLRDLDIDDDLLAYISKIPNALETSVNEMKLAVASRKRQRTNNEDTPEILAVADDEETRN